MEEKRYRTAEEGYRLYERLGYDSRLLLELAALIHLPLSPQRLTRAYSRLRLELGLKKIAVKRLLEELKRMGLLELDCGDVFCLRSITEDVAVAAVTTGQPTVLARVCGELVAEPMLSWRLAVYVGRELPRLSSSSRSDAIALIGAGISRPDTLDFYPKELRFELAVSTLDRSIEMALERDAVWTWLDQHRTEPQAAAMCAHQRLLRGKGGAGTPAGELLFQGRAQSLIAWPPPEFQFEEFLYQVARILQGEAPSAGESELHEALDWLARVQAGEARKLEFSVKKSLNHGTPLVRFMTSLLAYWAGFGPALDVGKLTLLCDQYRVAGYEALAEQLSRLCQVLIGDPEAASALMTAIQPSGQWQGLLDELDAWAGAAQPEERVVWLVRPEDRNPIKPKVQRLGKDGTWTEGQRVEIGALLERQESLDDHDWRVLDEWDRSGHQSGRELLAALMGHPRVYMADNEALRLPVSELVPTVVVNRNERGGKVNLRLDPWPRFCDEIIARCEATGLRLFTVTEEYMNLGRVLGENGVSLPGTELARVRLTLGRLLQKGLDLKGDLSSGATDLEKVHGDSRLRAQLVPFHTGVYCSLRVLPNEEIGEAFLPGDGHRLYTYQRGGRTLEVSRDLEAEQENWAQLQAKVPELERSDQGFPTAEQALELLEKLKEVPELELLWPEGETFRLRGKAEWDKLQLKVSGKQDWFALEGELHLSDQEKLTLLELLQKLRQGKRFIRLQDGSYVALTRELERRLLALDRVSEGDSLNGLKLHALAAGMVPEEQLVGADDSWRDQRRRFEEAVALDPRPVEGFKASLRPYQLEGFRWLARSAAWGVGVCLADDMGLGKTVQTLALLSARSGGPSLVVAPTSVCSNWLDEARRFAPGLKPHLLAEGDREASLAGAGPGDLIICSYGILVRETRLIHSVEWTNVVLDESQAIKNTTTKRFQAAIGITAEFRMATTGTPVENHLDELWALFRFLNPGLLGSQKRFQSRFGDPEEREALAELIRPFLLRRLKSQVLQDLPPRTDVTLRVELAPDEKLFYEGLRRSALEKVRQGGDSLVSILAELTRLRRACCHPSLVDPQSKLDSSKMETFLELLHDVLGGGHRVLVFSQFVTFLSLVRAQMDRRKISYQYLDGSTPAKKRKLAVKAFQEGAGEVFLISLKAGGVGLNLTAADYVIHLDPWWNPAVEDQASDRAHRIGQQRPVTVYRLIARDTIEEKILRLHEEKRRLADELLAGGDRSAKLSPEELLLLIQESSAEALR